MKKPWSPDKYLFAFFRRVWRWSPARKQVLREAVRKDGFMCSKCKQTVDRVVADHIDPVVDPTKGFQGWDVYYTRMFTSAENLQAICEPCHKKKTAAEGVIRRKRKKEDSH